MLVTQQFVTNEDLPPESETIRNLNSAKLKNNNNENES